MSLILSDDHPPWQLGTRVIKTRSDPEDAHPTGATGTVVGVIPVVESMIKEGMDRGHFYFIEWDIRPGLPVGIAEDKIRKVVPS